MHAASALSNVRGRPRGALASESRGVVLRQSPRGFAALETPDGRDRLLDPPTRLSGKGAGSGPLARRRTGRSRRSLHTG